METLVSKFKLILFAFQTLLIFHADSKAKTIDSKEFLLKEIVSQDKNHECPLRSCSKSSVYDLWYSDKISNKTHKCLLKYLENDSNDKVAWCMLGSLYTAKKEEKKANSCYQVASDLLRGSDITEVGTWHYLGPFIIGKSEFDGDPVMSHGGIQNVSRFRFNSKPPRYLSELLPNGEISWTKLNSGSGDYIQVRPQLDWNDLVSSLGSMGITEWQGWAVTHFATVQSEQTLSVQCLGVARCVIDSTVIPGDFYGRSDYWTSISLSKGLHQVFVPLRAKVAANFKFSIIKKSSVVVMAPSFLPQIYDGYLPKDVYISIPVSNLMSKKWLGINRVTVQDPSGAISWKASLQNKQYRIAPGQISHVVVKLSSPEIEEGEKLVGSCSDFHLKITFKTSEGSNELDVILKCRKRGSSFLFTFIDHDGSIQHAAAIEPLGFCPESVCPIVLSLHGTTVPPQNQADSYKRMIKGDFEFGVAKMWLLAPTRHGAHNWEGPGALTAMSSVEALDAMVQSCHWLKMKVDQSKILFAGHSMGGHGALHLATHFPDKAIGLMSLAGWVRKEDYGDSNLFFKHDIATSHVDPMTKSVMESCVAENDVDKLVSNLRDIPVLLRIGARDRTVHPFFLRKMYRLMKEARVNVEYSELPNLEHWWWDTKNTNDGGCMNDANIRSFIKSVYNSISLKEKSSSCSRDRGEGCDEAESNNLYSESRSGSERHITFVTYNPAFGGTMKGVKVLQQTASLQRSVIEMHKNGGRLIFVTRNIQCMSLTDEVDDAAINWINRGEDNLLSFEVDNNEIITSTGGASLILCKKGFTWAKVQSPPEMSRNYKDYGPARRVAERPFVIVAGTQGNDSVSRQILTHSTYIANQFMLTSDSLAPIVKDTDVQDYSLADKNLIIIGNQDENLLTAGYLEKLHDLKMDENHLSIGTACRYKLSQIGILTLSPHGRSGLALLLMGGAMTALTDVIHLATPTIPPMARSPFSNLLPDFVITGPHTGSQGPGGFECAGFWDNHWRYSSAASSCVCL